MLSKQNDLPFVLFFASHNTIVFNVQTFTIVDFDSLLLHWIYGICQILALYSMPEDIIERWNHKRRGTSQNRVRHQSLLLRTNYESVKFSYRIVFLCTRDQGDDTKESRAARENESRARFPGGAFSPGIPLVYIGQERRVAPIDRPWSSSSRTRISFQRLRLARLAHVQSRATLRFTLPALCSRVIVERSLRTCLSFFVYLDRLTSSSCNDKKYV